MKEVRQSVRKAARRGAHFILLRGTTCDRIFHSEFQFTCQITFILSIPVCVIGLFHPEVLGYFYFTKQ